MPPEAFVACPWSKQKVKLLLEKVVREEIEDVRDYKRSEVSWCKQAAPAADDAWVDFSTFLLNLWKQIKHKTETSLFQHCYSFCWALDSPFSLSLHLRTSAISADQRNTSMCLQKHTGFWMEVTGRGICKKEMKQLFLPCAAKQHNSYFFHDLHQMSHPVTWTLSLSLWVRPYSLIPVDRSTYCSNFTQECFLYHGLLNCSCYLKCKLTQWCNRDKFFSHYSTILHGILGDILFIQ